MHEKGWSIIQALAAIKKIKIQTVIQAFTVIRKLKFQQQNFFKNNFKKSVTKILQLLY